MLPFQRFFMFKIEQLHVLTGNLIGAIGKQRETGANNQSAIEVALAEFSSVWKSKEKKK
jgi:hypothetical protein